ncbi:MAG: S41 family peptidase [Bacteroidota bacterium]|jgi:carboxyl-terminal processing protease|nr:S41 family peptidase [Bacteroidota bacterium]
MFKQKFSVASVFVLLVFGIFMGTQIRAISEDNIYEQFNKFKDVLNYTQKYYVDDVKVGDLVTHAIEGMLKSLDPHSVYISPKQLEKVQEDFKGSFEGIGIEFRIVNDTITVANVIFGGPSEKVGVLAGDKIVAIDAETAIKLQNEDVQKKLRGEKGTKVTVSVMRSGISDPVDIIITRDKIPLYSVNSSFLLDDGVGYMSINRYAANTYDEFIDGLRQLKSQGMTKLVLDLRGNPGGYLEQSFRMANEFLKRGEKIVYTKGRRSDFDENYVATGGGEFQELPLIILINNGSASASEIVSGAVQDHDRGLIVGETSFGKGLVQRQFELADGSAFRLTTARYYTPSGRIIQRPYDGSDEDYYREAYDRDEEDSENIEHTEEADTTRPQHKTDAGRLVYGGGGITPDYIVRYENLKQYAARMRIHIFEFTTAYLDKEGARLRGKYEKPGASQFVRDFQVTDAMMKDFIAFGTARGVEFDEEHYAADKDWLRASVKAQIARTLFGNEGQFRVLLEVDPQFQKAVTLFPEAKRIAGLR